MVSFYPAFLDDDYRKRVEEAERDLPSLTRKLWRRGCREPEIRKVLGENFLRVFEAVAGR